MSFRDRTVFSPLRRPEGEPPRHPNEILALYFHRSAFLLYGCYALWGLLSIVVSIPSLANALGDVTQIVFSGAVFPLAAVAAYGALTFPRGGRFELYAGSTLVTLVLIETGISLTRIHSGDFTALNGLILSIARLIIPVGRCIFIFRTLIKNAGGDQ